MRDGQSVGELLRHVRAVLREGGIPTADLDARLLVGNVLNMDAAGLILRAGDPVSAGSAAIVEAGLGRRLAGEPVHRILGRRFFFDHDFILSPETLEPRPDTEVLVELAAEAFRAKAGRPLIFADVGTGSGAIAVSLLALFPASVCIATDLSEGALETARHNAAQAGVAKNFLPLRMDYLAALNGPIDAVVSNPPYIPSTEIDMLDAGVRDFDPRLALDGGADGLDAYRRIVAEAAGLLTTNGDLLLEIGQGQQPSVRVLAEAAGFRWTKSQKDLGGIERALWFRRDSSKV